MTIVSNIAVFQGNLVIFSVALALLKVSLADYCMQDACCFFTCQTQTTREQAEIRVKYPHGREFVERSKLLSASCLQSIIPHHCTPDVHFSLKYMHAYTDTNTWGVDGGGGVHALTLVAFPHLFC